MSLLAYDINGKGCPIVLLHGYLENRNMWDATVNQLKSIGKCISIDLPGHGASESDFSLSSINDIAERIQVLLVQLNIKQFHIVGHSLGGYVAIAYAKKYPEMLSSILLCHSTADADSREKKIHRDRAIITVSKFKKTYLYNSIPALFMEAQKNSYNSHISNMIKDASKINTKTIQQYLLMMKEREDSRVFIENTNIATAYIIGKNDPLFTATTLIQEANTANARHFLLENAGHMGHIENEKRFISTIYNFIYSLLDAK